MALSTTSVAVVYAVMVETGLNRQDLGKLILAACFVTDLGTVLALGGLFASYDWLLIVFVAVCAVTLVLLPRLVRLATARLGHRVSEPEIKLLLVILLGLGGLATQAGSEAVLPAYVGGLVVAGVFLHDRVLMDRLRSIAFALLTPFFFLRAGTLISAPALISGAGVIGSCCWSSWPPSWPASGRWRRHSGCRGGADLHHPAHGDGPHVRLDRGPVRLHPSPDRQGSVHRARHGRHPVRFRAHGDRPAALPASRSSTPTRRKLSARRTSRSSTAGLARRLRRLASRISEPRNGSACSRTAVTVTGPARAASRRRGGLSRKHQAEQRRCHDRRPARSDWPSRPPRAS